MAHHFMKKSPCRAKKHISFAEGEERDALFSPAYVQVMDRALAKVKDFPGRPVCSRGNRAQRPDTCRHLIAVVYD